MTREHDESQAVWKDTNNVVNWEEPDDLVDISTSHDIQVQGYSDTGATSQAEDEEDGWDESAHSKMGVLRQFAWQFSPVLAPLLLAVLTFVIVLPFMLRGKASLPESALIPFALVLIIFAALQGTLMYFANSNDGLWLLSIAAGFALFLLIGSYAIFGLFVSFILLILLLISGAIVARRVIHPTPEGYVDIVYSYGQYSRTLFPGPNFLLPWERVFSRLSIHEILWSTPMQKVPISRDQDVLFVASISFQLLPEDAHLAAINVKNWEENLRERFITTVQSVMNELSPEDFIAWQQSTHYRKKMDMPANDVSMATRWDKVNAALAQHMREQVAEWGVQINWVGIRDVTLMPHVSVSSDTGPGMNTRPAAVDTGVPRGAPSLSAQQKSHSRMPASEPMERAQPQYTQTTPHIPTQPASPPPVAAPPPGGKDEVLMEAYEAVRQGRVTDSETIRSIARRFEAVAADPEASKTVGFDATRAALVLYQRAQMFDEHANDDVSYDSDTQPDWQIRRPANDNLMAGG